MMSVLTEQDLVGAVMHCFKKPEQNDREIIARIYHLKHLSLLFSEI